MTDVLNASGNAAIKMAFGQSPTLYAVGELGGGHAAAGTDTVDSGITVAISPSDLSPTGNLVLGAFGGVMTGSATATLMVTYAGYDGGSGTVFDQTISASAVDGQALVQMPVSDLMYTGELSLDISLIVTTTGANDGFHVGFILGDPPPAAKFDFAEKRSEQGVSFPDHWR